MLLTNEFIKENKVDNKYQMVVMYCESEHIITNITDKNIMLKQISKLHRGNCGRFNSGRYRIANNENATEWYLKNRIIQ
jgi:hypothetical protein